MTHLMSFIPWSILLGLKMVVIILGIVLGVVNLADDYLNPPINNIGRLLAHFLSTIEEF